MSKIHYLGREYTTRGISEDLKEALGREAERLRDTTRTRVLTPGERKGLVDLCKATAAMVQIEESQARQDIYDEMTDAQLIELVLAESKGKPELADRVLALIP